MIINTKYLGKLSIKESDILTFVNGLPGFQDEIKFVLLNLSGELTSAFQILQSVKTPELAFIVTNPYYFYKDYELKLEEPIIEQLNITKEGDVTVLSIVTLKEPFSKSTMNLKAPLIINHDKRLGKQYILQTDNYDTRTPLIVSTAKEDK